MIRNTKVVLLVRLIPFVKRANKKLLQVKKTVLNYYKTAGLIHILMRWIVRDEFWKIDNLGHVMYNMSTETWIVDYDKKNKSWLYPNPITKSAITIMIQQDLPVQHIRYPQ